MRVLEIISRGRKEDPILGLQCLAKVVESNEKKLYRLKDERAEIY